MRLTLEQATPHGTSDRNVRPEVDLGEIAFIEMQDGWINCFVNTSDNPDAPDPDVKFMADFSGEEVYVWELRPEDMDVKNDNWVYRAQRLNVLNTEAMR